jgi:hypothetical protein
MEWLHWLNWVCVSPCILLAVILYGAYCVGRAIEWKARHDGAEVEGDTARARMDAGPAGGPSGI